MRASRSGTVIACVASLAGAAAVTAQTISSSPGPPPPGVAADLPRDSTPFGILSGHAEAHRRLADTVSDVSVGIEVRARDVAGVSAALAKRSGELLDYLRDQKVERLRTDQLGVDPVRPEASPDLGRVVGYQGRMSVSFRTRPDRLPALLAGCLDHGGNVIEQSGSSPGEDQVERARGELAAEAARLAMAQASTVAAAIGQRVVGVAELDIDASGGGPIRPMFRAASAQAVTAPVAAEPGETEITAGVSLRVRVLPQL